MVFFNTMTYQEKYYEIINNGLKDKPEIGYYEHHHIVPKSICPLLKNSKLNLIYLTAKNHFLAHYYIWKWFRDELHEKKWSRRMCYALNMMKRNVSKSNNIDELSKLYEEVKKDLRQAMKDNKYFMGKHHSAESRKKMSEALKGKQSSFKGKHHNEESRKKMSEAHKGHIPWNKGATGIFAGEKHWNYGKHLSDETKKKISASKKGRHLGKLWYNNGVVNVLTRECPEGFVKGRLPGLNVGRKLSEESRMKISASKKGRHFGKHWYNNGVISVLARECPDGFVKGRIC